MIISGKDVAQPTKAFVASQVKQLSPVPTLTIIRLGEDPDQVYYERSCQKILGNLGMCVKTVTLAEQTTQDVFDATFDQVNNDPTTHGILLLKPLPNHLSDAYASRVVQPEKDVDCFGDTNNLKIYAGDFTGFIPCTAQACLDTLDFMAIDLTGKRVAVAGYSMVVGKPLALALIARGATVKVCRSTTKDLVRELHDQDIVISAMGQAQMLTAQHFQKEAVVLDVGINYTDEGQLVGDVAFADVVDNVAAITPVPGGIGTVTNSVLARHVLKSYQLLESTY